MTNRERMLAVLYGRPHDRVPFVQYSNNIPNDQAWAMLGRENVGLIRWTRPYRIEYPHCAITSEPLHRNGLDGERRTLQTPAGKLTAEYFFDPTYHTAAAHERYVKEPADYDVLDAYLADAEVIYDRTPYDRDLTELGDDGLPMVVCPRTGWQQLWVEWVDIENLAWHIAEDEARVVGIIDRIASIHRRVYDCIRRCQPLFANLPDNITAPMISPAYFRRFCLPLYQEFTGMLAEDGIPVVSHMDGDLKTLAGVIGETGLRGLDSFSPQPDNDTSVAEALAQWPHMMLMMNFPSSVHIGTPDYIRAVTRQILAEGGGSGRLQVQLSENVPSPAWRTSLPIIVEEILAHGTPGCFR
jgi:hypothetical protein